MIDFTTSKRLIQLILLIVMPTWAYSQSSALCSGALPFCTGSNYQFQAGVNSPDAEIGPNYGCLQEQPNPIWYFMQVDQPGDIEIFMLGTSSFPTPTNDIDFICYGPFNNLNNVCNGQLTSANIVDCSYSTSATETVLIPNAQVGEFYLLLITNFSNLPCEIIFSQSNESDGNAGSTDCSLLFTTSLCFGDSLTLTGPSNLPGFTYNWFDVPDYGNSLNTTTVLTKPAVTFADSGLYALVSTSTFDGSTDTVFYNVEVYALPSVAFSPLSVCDESPLNFQNQTVLADMYGSIQDSWFWSFGHNEADSITPAVSQQENPVHVFPQAGNYSVTLWVESNFGCVDSLVQEISVDELPEAVFSYQMLCFEEVLFTNSTQEGTHPIESATWNFGDNSPLYSGNEEFVTHFYESTGDYLVNLSVTDTAGCLKDTTISVNVTETPGFDELPNVLTPNGDDINDSYSFLPIYDDCYEYTFTLFNRWGNKVFATERSDKGFQGISNLGSGLNDGVYFWVLSANRKIPSKETEIVKKGTLTIAGSK